MYMKTISAKSVPFVSRSEMIAVDRLMIERFGIQLLQMMENAGRNLCDLAQYLLQGNLTNKSIAVVCGGGNNGGGGLAAARHMANRGANIHVALAVPRSILKPVPAEQLGSLEQMHLDICEKFSKGEYDLIIDALIGYGLKGVPRDLFAEWIVRMNQSQAATLSLDIPSGLDADTGIAKGVCVEAKATMTLALPKKGMHYESARSKVGQLYLADIGVPSVLLESLGKTPKGVFESGAIVRLEN